MYFFHDGLVEYAVEYFRQTNFATFGEGDRYRELFAPGNTTDFKDRPFERFSDYEEMLRRLMKADQAKYERMHKGTPFYYMSWLAYDCRNYEKALFYLDSGISEDVRKCQGTAEPTAWKGDPGMKFLLLEDTHEVAQRVISDVRAALNRELTRFNAVSGLINLDLDTIRVFVRRLIEDPRQRSIVSALYIFALEFADRAQELDLRRGSTGGSSQPFTVHLFTGGLLFESLLKHYYPSNDTGGPNRQIGNVFHTTSFQTDFRLANVPTSSAITLAEIYNAIGGANTVDVAFATVANSRNTTGHNLVWDDVFSDHLTYTDLFHQVMNAILYIISVKGR